MDFDFNIFVKNNTTYYTYIDVMDHFHLQQTIDDDDDDIFTMCFS